ncbi:S9 family peptidase [candidate division KSB1 bacterium]|nr:S9 family peptidase [candidate division KSB1 bacterium]
MHIPKFIIPILFLLIAAPPIKAQKANFELAEKFTTQKMEKMASSLSVDPNWFKDENRFWYEYKNTDGKNWYVVDAEKRTKRTLFDKEDMAAQLAELFKKPFNSKDLPLKDFEYNKGKGLFTFHVDSIEVTYKLENRKLVKGDSLKKKPDEKWITYSPDSTWIAFARTHNLYIMKTDDPDSTEHQFTTDGEKWYSYQFDEKDTTSTKRLRARVEWFKHSRKLFSRRQDKRKMGDLWVINSLKKRPELETYKYSMPGEKHVAQTEVVVFDIESKQSIKLKIEIDGWKDLRMGNGRRSANTGFFTSKDSDDLYFIVRDRTWKKIAVCKANTTTGEVEVVISEESNPYVSRRFADVAVIEDGKEFIWWSERTGWGQLYRYDSKGTLKKRITNGYFIVGDMMKIDTLKQVIYFRGFGREKGVDPNYTMNYRINFDGTGLKLLSPENATHSFSMSDKMGYFVDNYSRVDMPAKSVLRDAKGRVVMELEETDISRMVEAGWKMPQVFTVKAADDVTDLYGVMWKPFDFDPAKKYPIIAYVYPGPQVEPFPISFTLTGSRARTVPLAQVGFVVIAMGQRGGSPLRSKYYHNYGYGDLRDYPLADNKYGIEQLAARHSFIDIKRVGIFGHSGGGFMSTAAILTYPDFYKVAVSSAGNHDNNVYNNSWSEVHNGIQEKTRKVKKKNEAGEAVEEDSTYWEARIESNTELAKNLKGKLLLVHSDRDNNVHPANTIRMADALMKEGKRFDFMLMPGQRHGFGKYTPYFERMMWYYFAEHLLGDYRTNVDYNIPKEKKD